MATVSKEIADELVRGNGYYEDDPRVRLIVEYTTPEGATAYGIIYPHESITKYCESQWVRSPRIYWSRTDECK